jgi:hypothetical protein
MGLLPAPNIELAYTSPNSAREDLKPVVEALAILLPVIFKSFEAARMPLSAVLKGIYVSQPYIKWPYG